MNGLAYQRCANHAQREAVARCPGCKRTFCRECVTEHDDRVWCTACLARQRVKTGSKRRGLRGIVRLALVVIGLFVLWSAFYFCGQALLAIPGSFHEGTFLTDMIGD